MAYLLKSPYFGVVPHVTKIQINSRETLATTEDGLYSHPKKLVLSVWEEYFIIIVIQFGVGYKNMQEKVRVNRDKIDKERDRYDN